MSAAEAQASQREMLNEELAIVQEEQALLAQILEEDFHCLTAVGDGVVEGFETVASESADKTRWHEIRYIISRGPSGQHYRWNWARGLTELQEHEGPSRDEIRLVKPLIEMVQTTTYVPMED